MAHKPLPFNAVHKLNTQDDKSTDNTCPLFQLSVFEQLYKKVPFYSVAIDENNPGSQKPIPASAGRRTVQYNGHRSIQQAARDNQN